MHLHWKPNLSTSALHAAEACWKYPQAISDPEIYSAMRPYAERLGAWIAELPVSDLQGFWDTLVVTGSAIESNRELACAVLEHVSLHDADGSRASLLAGLITDVEAAFRQLFPRYIEQSSFRFRPLQDQWLGYGRGLMTQWQRLTRRDSLAEACTILGLQPVMGGYGKSHPDHGLVCVEAVLTNARPELPEVIRLAWLLTQIEKPVGLFTHLESTSLTSLSPLALIPPILAAGQELELTKCDLAMTALAIQHWRVAMTNLAFIANLPTFQIAEMLLNWWGSGAGADSDWDVRLRMLAKQFGVSYS